MGIFDRFKRLFGVRDTVGYAIGAKSETVRQALTELDGMVGPVNPSFPVEFLDLIKRLALTNPDISQAIKRTINLANSGLTWSLVGATEATQQQADLLIRELMDQHPGIVNKLLRQECTSGAISAEYVPTLAMDGVEEMRLVPVPRVRFQRERSATGIECYVPYYMSMSGQLVSLNMEQYLYEAIETEEDSPYGIPPFISALRNVMIQIDGTSHIRSIMRKLGLTGFLSILRKRPRPNPGEESRAFRARLKSELEELRDSAGKPIREGLMFGYDDLTVQHNPVTGDARGHESVWRANEEQVSSGIDTDLFILGRNYNTTEALAKITGRLYLLKMANIRYPVERFLKRAITFHLRAKGLRFERVSGTWGKNISLDPVADATAEKTREEAEQIRQARILSLVPAGIIDNDAAAQELGFDKAVSKQPIAPAANSIVPDGSKKKASLSLVRNAAAG